MPVRIAHQADEKFGPRFIRDYIRRAPAVNGSDVQRAGAEYVIDRQFHFADGVQCVEQFLNRRIAQLGIGGVRHFPVRHQLHTGARLSIPGELVLGGFAVDDVFRTARISGRVISACAVSLLTDDEEQGKIPYALFEQALGGGDHRRDDALGVAGAAAPDEFVIDARGDPGRNGIHMSGERDDGIVEAGEDTPAVGLDLDFLDAAIMSGGDARQIGEEILPDVSFLGGYGRYVDQLSRQLEYMHKDLPGMRVRGE